MKGSEFLNFKKTQNPFFLAPCFFFPIFCRPDLFRRLFFSRVFYYCFPPSWETFIVFLFCLFREGRFFDILWDSPFAALFLLCPFFPMWKERALSYWRPFFAFLFLPFISKDPTRFQQKLAQLKFGCLISFWARCCFFLLGIRARSEWARCSPFILLGIWVSLVGVGQVLSFFVLGVWARYKRPSVHGFSALILQLSAETMVREFWRFIAETCFVS